MDHEFDESYPFVFIGHVWTVKDLKESVGFGHGRIDQVELKAFKHDSALKEAKGALEKKYPYLEAYSRRENLKFAGIPES